MSDMMRAMAGDGDYYRLFFADGRRAEADFEKDIHGYLLGVLYSISGDIGAGNQLDGLLERGGTLGDLLTIPDRLPPWLDQEDLDFYVGEFERTGLTGGFNYYRNIDVLPACLAPFLGRTIEQPAFYLCGEFDLIAGNTPEAHGVVKASLPDLRGFHVLDGAGHWLQQERANEVSDLLVGFVNDL
jgi:pimeloyl-ACP methyl ester carboxylesterase